MDLELNRLASYDEYQGERGHLSCITLARLGYFYDGHQIICFQCHVPLPADDNITAENLDEVHRRNNSNCSLRETVNVPLAQPQCPLTESDGAPPKEPITAVYRQALTRAKSRGIFPGDTHPVKELTKHEKFREKAARLASFLGWPQGAPVQPDTLAAAGFFYTGSGDTVCCAFCDGVLSGWERGDDPITEHERHYGDRNCPYRRHQRQNRRDGYGHDSGPEVDGNDRQRSNFPKTTTPIERSDWSERWTVMGNESPSFPRLSLLTAKQSTRGHRHPEFADQLQRLRTYPSEVFRSGQRSEALAKAGFFYEGPEDRVRCFHCAGLLKNWQPADVPLDEHEMWFPECQFVQSLRNDVTSRQIKTSAFSLGPPSAHFCSNSVFRVEPREIKARMDSASVVALLKMGFSRTLIRQAIEIRLTTTGDDFPSAESLLEAVFELQEKMSLASSDGPRDHGNCEQAGHLTSSTVSHVIAAADKKAFVKQAAPVNQLSSQMTHTSDASASNESVRGTPASEAAASRDTSISQQDKQKNKTRRRTKKHSQKKKPDTHKTIESNDAVNSNCAEEPLETIEGNQTGLDEDAEIIVQENRKLKEARTCKVCLDSEVNTVFLPCGHLVCCHSCSSSLKVCPMCRTLIRGTVRVFLP